MAIIIWEEPKKIVNDTDVNNKGTLVYAYDWNNINQIVNNISFIGTNVFNGNIGQDIHVNAGTNFTTNLVLVYGVSAALSPEYKKILSGSIGMLIVDGQWI